MTEPALNTAPDAAPLVEQPQPAAPTPAPSDPLAFIREDRIHVKDGSLFLGPTLVLHRHLLKPENEQALEQTLRHVFVLNQPHFFDSAERTAIGNQLMQLVPVSLVAKHAAVMKGVEEYNAEVKTGVDKELNEEIASRKQPFTALTKQVMDEKKTPQMLAEGQRNALALYFMLQEKIAVNGFPADLTAYAKRPSSPDQLLGELERYTGITPLAFREAALQGGLPCVGALMGFSPEEIAKITEIADYAQTRDCSDNVMANARRGIKAAGVHAPLPQLLEAGMEARIKDEIPHYRAMAKGKFEAPAAVQREELQVAEALKLIDPVQRQLLYKQGYEICYTPENTADSIASASHVFGLHRKSTDNPRDISGGSPKIYYSGHGNLENAHCTLVHEVAHNLFPDRFPPEQISAIDQLMNSDAARLETLNRFLTDPTPGEGGLTHFDQLAKLVGAYQAGNAEEKAAVLAAANTLFAPTGITLDALMPHLHDPERLRTMVDRAHMDLRIEGSRYLNGGHYNNPEERCREMLSRFAEMKQVRLRAEPDMLNFIAPGMNQVFDQYYLPHLHSVLSALDQERAPNPQAIIPTTALIPPPPVVTVPGHPQPAANDAGMGSATVVPLVPPAAAAPTAATVAVAAPALTTAAPEALAPSVQPMGNAHANGCACTACTPGKPGTVINAPVAAQQALQAEPGLLSANAR